MFLSNGKNCTHLQVVCRYRTWLENFKGNNFYLQIVASNSKLALLLTNCRLKVYIQFG